MNEDDKLDGLFVLAVNNGYVIRPAYLAGRKGTDERSWIASDKDGVALLLQVLLGAPRELRKKPVASLPPQPELNSVPVQEVPAGRYLEPDGP